MTTYRDEGSADVRQDDSATPLQSPSAVPRWSEGTLTAPGPSDGEPLMGAVLDLVHDLDEQVTHLKAALQSNRRIGIAMGIVMRQLRVSDEEAFVALRRASQQGNRKLRDVAEDVIYSGHLATGG